MTTATTYDPATAIAKWPNVPACYGWLSLDRRGGWRFQGETVTHAGLNAFLNRFYTHDGDGNWIVQNGPQKVFVSLDYMPLVLRYDGEDRLHTHTGTPAGTIGAVYLDEDGSVLMRTEAGPGLLDDRDLAAFLETCRAADGTPASEADLLATLAGRGQDRGVSWNGLPVGSVRRADAPAVFGFNPAPAPPDSTPALAATSG